MCRELMADLPLLPGPYVRGADIFLPESFRGAARARMGPTTHNGQSSAIDESSLRARGVDSYTGVKSGGSLPWPSSSCRSRGADIPTGGSISWGNRPGPHAVGRI